MHDRHVMIHLKVWHVSVKKWTRHNRHQNVQLFNILTKCSALLWECECFYSEQSYFSSHFSASFCWQMTFNHLHPHSHFLERKKDNSSQWIGCTIFKTSLVHFKIPRCTLSPSLCSLHSGVEPLFGHGVLGRASKAFILGFAALYYAGKHRATHAWPLTSLWSSATDERRGGVRLLIGFNIALREKWLTG